MALDRCELICLNENGEEGNIIKAKGKSLKIGYYMNSDYVHEHPLAKGLHCEINSDAFGRITITNSCADNPIQLDGVSVLKKRPLLHGMKISILDQTFVWKNSNVKLTKDVLKERDRIQNENDIMTPTKQLLLVPEQPPNSEPKDILRDRNVYDLGNRLTVHNFNYCINSDEIEDCSRNESDFKHDQIVNTSGNSFRKSMQKSELLNNSKETSCIKGQLTLCKRSDMTITSYSPRITGVQIDKSFACVKPNTPKSVYSTPKGVMLDCTADYSHELNLNNYSSANLCSKRRSMHVIDLTTPTKFQTGSNNLKRSILNSSSIVKSAQKSAIKPKVLAKVIEEQMKNSPKYTTSEEPDDTTVKCEKTQELSVDDVYEILSETDSSNIIDLSENESSLIRASTSTPSKRTPVKQVTKTPQSLMKQALLTSTKKAEISKQSPTSQKVTTPSYRRQSLLSTPTRSLLVNTSLHRHKKAELETSRRLSISNSNSKTSQRLEPLSTSRKHLDSPLRRSIVKRNTIGKSRLSQSAFKLSVDDMQEITRPVRLRRYSMHENSKIVDQESTELISKANKEGDNTAAINTLPTKTEEDKINETNLDESKLNETFTVESDEEFNENGVLIKLPTTTTEKILRANEVIDLMKTSKKKDDTPQKKTVQKDLQTLHKPKNTFTNTPKKKGNNEMLKSPQRNLMNEKVLLQTPVQESNISILSDSKISLGGVKAQYSSTPKHKSILKIRCLRSPKVVNSPDPKNLHLPELNELEDELEDVFKTPSAKNKMILNSPKSVNVSNDTTSVELLHRTEYDLTEDIKKVDSVFENEDIRFMPSEETILETPQDNLEDNKVLSSDEALAKLINKPILLKDYSRKEKRSELSFKNVVSNNLDFPKTDIQEWIDNIDIINTLSEEKHKTLTDMDKPETALDQSTVSTKTEFGDNLGCPKTYSTSDISGIEVLDDTNSTLSSSINLAVSETSEDCNIIEDDSEKSESDDHDESLKTTKKDQDHNISKNTSVDSESSLTVQHLTLDQKSWDKLSVVYSAVNNTENEMYTNLDEYSNVSTSNKTDRNQTSDLITTPIERNFRNEPCALESSKKECEKELLFENFNENSTVSGPRQALTPGPKPKLTAEDSLKRNVRKTMGQKPLDESFDLESGKTEHEKELLFENFDEHSTVSGTRQALTPGPKPKLNPEESLKRNVRKTMGQKPLDESFDLESAKTEREKELLFENFDEHFTVSGTRQALTPGPKPKLTAEESLKRNVRKTMGQKPLDESFDLESAKTEREKELLFENFDEHATVSETRQALTPGPKPKLTAEESLKRNVRKTMGQKPLDESFDLESAKTEREKELLFENFDEHSTVSGTRQALTPGPKPKLNPEESLKRNVRKTMGQKPLDESFDLESAKTEREKELLFENFDEHSTVSGTRQALTPGPKPKLTAEESLKRNVRKTMGQKPLDESFDLESAKTEREKELLFENFDEHSTVSGTRQALTPGPKPKLTAEESLKRNVRKTMGQKPLDESFDLESAKTEREKELLFENFDEHSTVSGTRQALTPGPKPKLTAEESLKRNVRKTMGQKPLDESFDLESAKTEREKELLFENFDEHSTVNGNRQALTPGPKPKLTAEESLKRNVRKTMGQKPLDESFDLESAKTEREKELLFENFDEHSTVSGNRQALTPGPKPKLTAEESLKRNVRKTMGQKPLDESFDLESAKTEREKELLFENFDEHSTVNGNRQALTPGPKPKLTAEESLKRNVRKTMGQKPLDESFDLESAKTEREKELLFENFDEHSTVSGTRQALTPGPKPRLTAEESLKRNVRKTMGQKPLDESFDLESAKTEREKELLFENFDEHATVSGTRQALTPGPKPKLTAEESLKRNVRKTMGQKPLDESFDLESAKTKREKELLFENFDEHSTVSGNRQALTPGPKPKLTAEESLKRNVRKTMGQKPLDESFDLESAKTEREKELLFENFDEHSTVNGNRQALTPGPKPKLTAEKSLKRNVRKTMGQKPLDESFDLESAKTEREKELLFENFDEHSTVSGTRQALTPGPKPKLTAEESLKRNVRKTMGQKPLDESFDLESAKTEREKELLFENFDEHSTVSGTRQALTPGPKPKLTAKESLKRNVRKTMGQKPLDESFDLESAKTEREKELLFENFDEHATVSGTRQAITPGPKPKLTAEESLKRNVRKTMGQKPLDESFDLESAKTEREKELLFENFDEHSTVSGTRQALTPGPKPKLTAEESLKRNVRKTMGQKPLDESFDLESAKTEREKELLFENFDEHSTVSGTRQALTPGPKPKLTAEESLKRNLRKTMGQKPLDESFDLESAKTEREKELLFENFDEHATVSGTRQALTPGPKPKLTAEESLKRNVRKTMGQKPLDESFDLESAKTEREKELLFENFDEHSTVSGTRQAITPGPKPKLTAEESLKRNVRKTMGQKPLDESFDLESAKTEREKELLFENFDEHATVSGTRQALTPGPKPKLTAEESLKRNVRKTMGQKPLDESFDLESAKTEREKELLFENFDEHATVSGTRQAITPGPKPKLTAEESLKRNVRKTMGQKPLDESFDLESAKTEREKELLFENFDEHSTVSGTRQTLTPGPKPRLTAEESLKRNVRKTMGQKPLDESFDLESAKTEREKELLFENFDEHSTVSGTRQALTPGPKPKLTAEESLKRNVRKTMGQKPLDESFDLESAKTEREKELLFENFDEHATVSGTRQAITPGPKPKLTAEESLKRNVRKTMGQKPLDESFDLESAKTEREKELLFENFDEHSTVSGTRQALTPGPKPKLTAEESLKRNVRKTMGQKPLDESFDLESAKTEREKELLFENFDEHSTVSETRQALTPGPKPKLTAEESLKRNVRKTMGQKPLDESFDLESAKTEREKELLFENFDEHSTVSGTRQALTPGPKPKLTAEESLKRNVRKTMGQKPLDESFDLESAKTEREKELLFENFDEHATVSGTRQALTPGPKPKLTAEESLKRNVRKTMGQKPLDESFDLESAKTEYEKELKMDEESFGSNVNAISHGCLKHDAINEVSTSLSPIESDKKINKSDIAQLKNDEIKTVIKTELFSDCEDTIVSNNLTEKQLETPTKTKRRRIIASKIESCNVANIKTESCSHKGKDIPFKAHISVNDVSNVEIKSLRRKRTIVNLIDHNISNKNSEIDNKLSTPVERKTRRGKKAGSQIENKTMIEGGKSPKINAINSEYLTSDASKLEPPTKTRRGRNAETVFDAENDTIIKEGTTSDSNINTVNAKNLMADVSKLEPSVRSRRGRKAETKLESKNGTITKDATTTDSDTNTENSKNFTADVSKLEPTYKTRRGRKAETELENKNEATTNDSTTSDSDINTENSKSLTADDSKLKPSIKTRRGRKAETNLESNNGTVTKDATTTDSDTNTENSKSLTADTTTLAPSTKTKRGRKAETELKGENDTNRKDANTSDCDINTENSKNLTADFSNLEPSTKTRRGRKAETKLESNNGTVTKDATTTDSVTNTENSKSLTADTTTLAPSTKTKRGRKAETELKGENDTNRKDANTSDCDINTENSKNLTADVSNLEPSSKTRRGRKAETTKLENKNEPITKDATTTDSVTTTQNSKSLTADTTTLTPSTKTKRGRKAETELKGENDTNIKDANISDCDINTENSKNLTADVSNLEPSSKTRRGRKAETTKLENKNEPITKDATTSDSDINTENSINITVDTTALKQSTKVRRGKVKPECKNEIKTDTTTSDCETNIVSSKTLKLEPPSRTRRGRKADIDSRQPENENIIKDATTSESEINTFSSKDVTLDDSKLEASTKTRRGRRAETRPESEKDLIVKDDFKLEPPSKTRRGKKLEITSTSESETDIAIAKPMCEETPSKTRRVRKTALLNIGQEDDKNSLNVISDLTQSVKNENDSTKSTENATKLITRTRRVQIKENNGTPLKGNDNIIEIDQDHMTPKKIQSQKKIISDTCTPIEFKTPITAAPKTKTRRLRSNSTCTPISLPTDLIKPQEPSNSPEIRLPKSVATESRRRLRSTSERGESMQDVKQLTYSQPVLRGRRKVVENTDTHNQNESYVQDSNNKSAISDNSPLPKKRSKRNTEFETYLDGSDDASNQVIRQDALKIEQTEAIKKKPSRSKKDIVVSEVIQITDPDEEEITQKRSTRSRKKLN